MYSNCPDVSIAADALACDVGSYHLYAQSPESMETTRASFVVDFEDVQRHDHGMNASEQRKLPPYSHRRSPSGLVHVDLADASADDAHMVTHGAGKFKLAGPAKPESLARPGSPHQPLAECSLGRSDPSLRRVYTELYKQRSSNVSGKPLPRSVRPGSSRAVRALQQKHTFHACLRATTLEPTFAGCGFRCPVCRAVHSNRRSTEMHMASHLDSTAYACARCTLLLVKTDPVLEHGRGGACPSHP